MSKQPLKELLILAQQVDPSFHDQIVGPWSDIEPWRAGVPKPLTATAALTPSPPDGLEVEGSFVDLPSFRRSG